MDRLAHVAPDLGHQALVSKVRAAEMALNLEHSVQLAGQPSSSPA